jgi:hypothetical protein
VLRFEFASYLTYCSYKGNGSKNDIRNKARTIMYYLKQDKSIGQPPLVFSKFISKKIYNNFDKLPFKNFFGKEVFLIPVPGSSLMKKGDLWVPENLTQSFQEQGLGISFPCLERKRKVPKSAFCKSNERPEPEEHYNSIEVKSLMKHMYEPLRIILVDDIITRGSTMLGCINLLEEVFPKADIKGFAIMRTISDIELFKDIEDPCVGTVRYQNGNLRREP